MRVKSASIQSTRRTVVRLFPPTAQKFGSSSKRVPWRGLFISLGALLVAVFASTVFRDSLDKSEDLLWSLALVPALLLAYHKSWKNVGIALAVGMALLWSTYLVGYTLSLPIEEWPAFLPVVSAYIAIALGSGWISEVQATVDELRAKEKELQEAYVVLHASHEAHKSAQLQLIHAEKLESIGLLATGVAHEVKNPLMTLLTGVQYLREFAPPEEDDVKQLLDDMLLAVRRADSVIKGLLDYSRARELVLKDEDVNKLVERTLLFVKHECDKARVAVTRDFAEDLPPLTIDGYKVQQVLVNLFTNAIHAMSGGGTLKVRTTLDGDTEEVPQGVMIEVQDTGPGIPPDSLSKIFDPFFTTKPTGQGTGLGLAVSRQIMEMHGGTLDLQNSESGVLGRLIFKPDTGGS